ncbi:protein of unknown function [Xenorhabdus bovienii]|uniref:Uncharacterized protein n=1 Tax=Xenorhabdus bovienii TaxID=40576 RepID=A0A0B6XGM5_XENBV|nr:protein of unknown function [Xenorhabdus bovienii]
MVLCRLSQGMTWCYHGLSLFANSTHYHYKKFRNMLILYIILIFPIIFKLPLLA